MEFTIHTKNPNVSFILCDDDELWSHCIWISFPLLTNILVGIMMVFFFVSSAKRPKIKHMTSPMSRYVRYKGKRKILARTKRINYACKLCQTSFLPREIELCSVLSSRCSKQNDMTINVVFRSNEKCNLSSNLLQSRGHYNPPYVFFK